MTDPERSLERAYGINPAPSRAAYMRQYRATHPEYRDRANRRKRERYWEAKEGGDATA